MLTLGNNVPTRDCSSACRNALVAAIDGGSVGSLLPPTDAATERTRRRAATSRARIATDPDFLCAGAPPLVWVSSSSDSSPPCASSTHASLLRSPSESLLSSAMLRRASSALHRNSPFSTRSTCVMQAALITTRSSATLMCCTRSSALVMLVCQGQKRQRGGRSTGTMLALTHLFFITSLCFRRILACFRD